MKRALAVACCILTLAGCGSNTQAPAPEPEVITATEGYQAVPIGGYYAEVPENWPVHDNTIYFGDDGDYPYINYMVITDYQTINKMLPNQSIREEFAKSACDGLYGENTGYSCSDVKEQEYKGNPSMVFNAAGYLNGTAITFICHLFNNPGGGILAYSLCSRAEESVDAIDTYTKIMGDMIPANFE